MGKTTQPMIRVTFCLAVAIVTGCGSSTNSNQQPAAAGAAIQSLQLAGQGKLADGTPVASQNIQYQLILDGANLFQAGVNGCLPTPAHVAGTVIQDSNSDSNGAFALTMPIGQFRAAVVRQCSLTQLHTSQVEGLTVHASIAADATSCPAYCSARGDPSAACVSDCSTGNRTITAAQTLTAEQSVALLGGDGVIRWTTSLTFSKLGPTLTPGGLPDLEVDGEAAQGTARVVHESYAADSCEIAERCVRAPGPRTLLRFDGTIQNLGTADLVIGSPTDSGLFQKSSCHNVELLRNIMLYELIDPSTQQVVRVDGQDVVGRKQGFCMMDISQVNASAAQGQYDCDNQGITAGWADVYDSDLDCQYLDITGVSSGSYILRLTVNPDGLFDESDTANNSVDVPVTIPGS